MSAKLTCRACFLAVLLSGCNTSARADTTETQVFEMIPPSDGSNIGTFLSELKNIRNLPETGSVLKAKVSLNTALQENPDEIIACAGRSQSRLSALSENQNIDCAYPDPLNLSEFDELWVDYSTGDAASPDTIFVDIAGVNLDYSTAAITFRSEVGAGIYNPLNEINPAGAQWLPKDKWYIIRRILRLPPDQNWRYQSVGKLLAVQRRLHQDLQNIDVVDLVFNPGYLIESINFRIALGDNSAPGTMIELNSGMCRFRDEKGGRLCSLDIKKILGPRFPGTKKKFLQEIIIFVRGATAPFTGGYPVRRVVFSGLAGNAGLSRQIASREDKLLVSAIPLPAHLERASTGTGRMVVDLLPLKLAGSVVSKEIKVSVSPKRFEVKRIGVVHKHFNAFPAYFNEGRMLISQWGGPFLSVFPSETRSEWPEILAYTVVNRSSLMLSGKEQTALQRSGNRLDIGSSKSFEVIPSGRGVSISGSGGELELVWPVAVSIKPGTVFYLDGALASDLNRATELKATFTDGTAINITANPNEPVIFSKKGKLKSIKVRVNMGEMPFELKLFSVVLFNPVLLTKEQAFYTKLPKADNLARLVSVNELVSAFDEYLNWAVLKIHNVPLKFTREREDGRKLINGQLSLTADPSSISKLIAADGDVELVEHRWFSVHEATVESAAGSPVVKAQAGSSLSSESFINKHRALVASLIALGLVWFLLPEITRLFDKCAESLGVIFSRLIFAKTTWLIFWAVVTLCSLTFGVMGGSKPLRNFAANCGNLSCVFFLKYLHDVSLPIFMRISPGIAKRIFKGGAEQYFQLAIALLGVTACLLCSGLPRPAENAALITYNCLLVSVLSMAAEVFRKDGQV